MIWTTYKEKIKRISTRIVDAQKPIRILEAIKWDPSIEIELRKSRFKQMPKIGPEHYEKTSSLDFDAYKKIEELKSIITDIDLLLGEGDSLGNLLKKITHEYIVVVEMLLARGTKEFWIKSKQLYGSPKDLLIDDKNTIRGLGQMLYEILSGFENHNIGPDYPEVVDAEEAVHILNSRFKKYFPQHGVEARLSDGILADAAAGGDVVKVKEGTTFSQREIDILEVHEGWVHVGTTQNGQNQHVARWLSKGPPRVAATQEGLAVIMEIFTFRSYPKRARIINDRILGIDKAEDGANLIELIEFYRTEGYSEEDCLSSAKRVFRGGVIEGGAPFTKDIAYCKGFVENYNFMRAAIRLGKPYLIPFLFVGKIHVDDIPLLYQKYKEGVVDPPLHLPAQFRDLNGVAVWMSFSSFLNAVDLKRIQEHYDKLFKTYL
ncbi:flavohemoglobin expression-modulating QEGLA motif protein [Bdellovibrionota bacterium FG-1]